MTTLDAPEVTTLDRIQERAASAKPGKALASVLLSPFWLIGWIVGFVWLALKLMGGAVAVGFTDAKGNRSTGDG